MNSTKSNLNIKFCFNENKSSVDHDSTHINKKDIRCKQKTACRKLSL